MKVNNKSKEKNNKVLIAGLMVSIFAASALSSAGTAAYFQYLSPTTTSDMSSESATEVVQNKVYDVTRSYLTNYYGTNGEGDDGTTGIIVKTEDAKEIARQAADLVTAALINHSIKGVVTESDLTAFEDHILEMISSYNLTDNQTQELAKVVAAIIEADLDSLNSGDASSTALSEAVVRNISDLEQRLSAAESRLTALEDSLNSLRSDVEGLKSQSTNQYASSASVSDLTSKYNELLTQYNTQTTKINEIASSNTNNMTLIELQNSLNTLSDSLETMKSNVQTQINVLNQAVTEISASKNSNAASSEAAAMQQKLELQESKIKELQSTTDNLNVSITTKQTDISTLNSQLNDKQAQIIALQSTTQSLASQVQNTESSLAQAQANLAIAQQEIDTLTTDQASQIAEKQQQIDTLNTTVNLLTEQLSDTQDQLTTAQQELANLEDTSEAAINNKQQQIDSLTELVNSMSADLNDAQNELTEARQDIADLSELSGGGFAEKQQQVDALNDTVTALTAELTQTKGKLTTAETDLTGAQEDIALLEASIATTQSELDTLKTDYQQKSADLAQAKTDIVALQNALNSVSAAVTTNTNDISNIQTDIEDLNRTLASIEEQKANVSTLKNLVGGMITALGGETPEQTQTLDDTTDPDTGVVTKGTVTVAQERLTALQELVSSLSDRVAALETQVGGLKEKTEHIGNNVSIGDDATIAEGVNVPFSLYKDTSGSTTRYGYVNESGEFVDFKSQADIDAARMAATAAAKQGNATTDKVVAGFTFTNGDEINLEGTMQTARVTGKANDDGTYTYSIEGGKYTGDEGSTGNIVKAQISGPTSIGVSEQTTISSGYVKDPIVITAKSLLEQTPGTAIRKHILHDELAWVGGTQLKGTMPEVTLTGGTNASGGYTASIPKNGYTQDGDDGAVQSVTVPKGTIVGAINGNDGWTVTFPKQRYTGDSDQVVTVDKASVAGAINGNDGWTVSIAAKSYTGNSGSSTTINKASVSGAAQSDGTFKYSIAAKSYTGASGSSGSIAKMTPSYSSGSSQTAVKASGTVTIPANTYVKDKITITAASLASQTSATASKENILTGTSAWVNGTKLDGSMANNGSNNITGSVAVSGTTNITIPAGYYNGSGKVKVAGPTLSGNANTGHVLSGQTFYSNSGTKQTGSMPNNGALNWNPSGSESKTIAAGYYSGGTISTSNAYNTGYNAGVTAADNRVNTNSANYKGGYNQGVSDADGRANSNSYNWKDGYNNGVSAADNRANSNSVNWKDGYNNGYTQGQNDVKAHPENYLYATASEAADPANISHYIGASGDYYTIHNLPVGYYYTPAGHEHYAPEIRINYADRQKTVIWQDGYAEGFEKGKRYVLSNHANYIGVRGGKGECIATHDQYDILSGTTLKFTNMTGGNDKRIVVSTANTGKFGDIYDSGYTYDTDISIYLASGGNLSISIITRDGSEQRAWYSFTNSSY